MERENISLRKGGTYITNRRQPVARNEIERAVRRFKARFCEHINCPDSEYEDRIFRELLYAHAKPIAAVIRKLNPAFFSEDLKFIHYLSEAQDYREAAASVADFRDANLSRANGLRRRLRIRLSGRKAGRLVRRMFIDSLD